MIKGKNADAFLIKSKYWGYEKEHRFFSTPGLQLLSDIGLTLKCVFFYSDKFDKTTGAPKVEYW